MTGGLAFVVAALAVWSSSGSAGAEAAARNTVSALTLSENFETEVSRHRVILVFFYAPWCGYCKKLHPEFDQAAATLRLSNPPIPLAKINCDSNKKTCNRYGATSFPKLKLFRHGSAVQDYSGTRDAGSLVRLMTLKAGPSFKVLFTKDDLTNFHRSNEHSIVGFFQSNMTSMAGHFKELSEYLVEKHRFAFTTSDELRQDYGPEECIVLFRPSRLSSIYEPYLIKTSIDRDLNGLLTWSADIKHGMCGHRYPSNTDEFQNRPLVVLYFDVNFETNKDATLEFRNRILEASLQLRGSNVTAHFAFSNAKDFQKELETFGLEPPASGKFAAAARDSLESKFATTGIETSKEIADFVRAFLNGRIAQFVMSEPAQEESEDDLVKIVVGSTFESIVLDPTKDVLVEIFAPWCGTCRRLAPIYWQLGEAMIAEPDIVIAKMNGAANDSPHPRYRTAKYPTIYFAPKGSKDHPRVYQGPKALQSLIEFVASEASSDLTAFTRHGSPRMPDREL